MRLVVDRLENNYAVCENSEREMIHIPIGDCPDGLCEGDVLELNGGTAVILHDETEKRKSQMQDRFFKLFP